MLCRPRESIRPGSLRFAKSFEECCWSTVMTAACHWPSCHYIPVQKFVSLSRELNHDRSPLVLDTDKGVCCHRSFSVYISGFQPCRWREPNPDLRFCWRASLKNFKTIQLTHFVLQQSEVCYKNILDVLLKECWGPRKGRLGAECVPRTGVENHWSTWIGRQSQPSRRGCHSQELQDQTLTFCRRFGIASIFSTVFSMHSIGFLLRATETDWKSAQTFRGTMSLNKP